MGDKLDQHVLARLAEPFRPEQVRWKPQVISETGSALAVAYVDPRVVSERLDEVVGGDWSFHWEPLGVQGDRLVVKSSLTVMGVTREDVGEYVLTDREQADPWKSAVSDALKRAAVHFGVGRYLYWLEATWVSYDRRRHEFIDEPYIDGEGRVRVRRRQVEASSTMVESRHSERREQSAKSQSAGRTRGERPPVESHQSHAARVREGAAEVYGVPWGAELLVWAARYMEHQNVAAVAAADVVAWLCEHQELHARMEDYPALSDAQAAFIRGLPKYIQAHQSA